jgi:hypothetical protein
MPGGWPSSWEKWIEGLPCGCNRGEQDCGVKGRRQTASSAWPTTEDLDCPAGKLDLVTNVTRSS